MIDAAACGLPIIVNDTLQATERIDGNGITYKLGDLDDLIRAISSLGDNTLRRELGRAGAEKMLHHFSWKATARARLRDYDEALRKHGKLASVRPSAPDTSPVRNHEGQ
jgi:glycosyltransferase involved in cell wall biosynthesis